MRTEGVEAMMSCFAEAWGNASSLHSSGRRARRTLETARRTVAEVLGCSPEEVCLTGGGTESNNLAIKGVLMIDRAQGGHLVTSAVEHHAVLNAARYLEGRSHEVTYLSVDRYGMVDVAELEKSLRNETVLVSVMLANNEVGTIQPISQIAKITRERAILLHTDAVQAAGRVSLDVDALGVDLLSLAAHKFHGPKGVGVLYVRKGTSLRPLLHGGDQERGLWPGTENVAGAVGLATTLQLANQEREAETRRIARLRDKLQQGILESIPDVQINGHLSSRLPNILNVSFKGVDGGALLLWLDQEGIAVSTASACSAGTGGPSHVLMAMGLAQEEALNSVRFSLGRDNNDEQIDYVLEVLPELVRRLRS
jgi:cysteine desulfurase